MADTSRRFGFNFGDGPAMTTLEMNPDVTAVSLVPKTDQVLRTPAEKINLHTPQMPLYELYKQLGDTLIAQKGLGLAAPQIGIPLRAFVIRSSPIQIFINPTVVDVSEETVEMEEGCLTFPGVMLKIERPRVIRIRYADLSGQYQTNKFQDMTARVILHELDHLNGVLFGHRVGDMSLELALKRAKKTGYSYLKSDLK